VVHDDGFGLLAVDVPVQGWLEAIRLARDELGLAFFDWLSAIDELDEGFRLVCHVAAHRPRLVEHLMVRTRLPRESPAVASVAEVFAGAEWHERETHEMFGVEFLRGGEVLDLASLLLPDSFEGHPLRKDFVLASRVAKDWPGAKEPGEGSDAETPARRRPRPAGVPDPREWGPDPAITDEGTGKGTDKGGDG
jgi:NADH-quinone oxidoreductase subunit C